MTATPPTLAFESPNLATLLRLMISPDRSWPQYVPTFVGAVGVAVLWYRRRQTFAWSQELPGLVLWSCLLTAYGAWALDLVVLLVPIIATAAIVVRTDRRSLIAGGAAAFLAISLIAVVMHQTRVPQAAFVWMTPAVFLCSAALAWSARSRHSGGADSPTRIRTTFGSAKTATAGE